MTELLRKLSLTTDRTASLGLLVVRVGFGLLLALGHGLGKVSDLAGFTATVEKLGFFLPQVLGPAAALGEFAGGLLVAVGLLTRPAAGAMLGVMLTAFFVVHADDPFAKKELSLTFAIAASSILVAGPGRYSLDFWFGRRARA